MVTPEMIASVSVPGAFMFVCAMCFPQIRAAFADRLRGRSGAGAAEVATTVAEVRALRGEIYALRSELAAVSRALPPAGTPPGGRVGSGN
jgi:hypothetical protein